MHIQELNYLCCEIIHLRIYWAMMWTREKCIKCFLFSFSFCSVYQEHLPTFFPIRSQTGSVIWQELPICTQPGIILTPQQGIQLSGHFDTTLFRIPLLTFTSRMWLPNQKCTFMELKTMKSEWKQLGSSSFIGLLGNAALISSHIGQIRKVKMVSYWVLDLSFFFFLSLSLNYWLSIASFCDLWHLQYHNYDCSRFLFLEVSISEVLRAPTWFYSSTFTDILLNYKIQVSWPDQSQKQSYYC